MPPPADDDGRKRKQARWLADAYAAGIAFPAGAGGGLLIGWWLDKLFGTKYWLTSIFAALGVIAAFINLFRLGTRDDGTGQ
jgi:F0F1-type ATP synthase assembly protein I